MFRPIVHKQKDLMDYKHRDKTLEQANTSINLHSHAKHNEAVDVYPLLKLITFSIHKYVQMTNKETIHLANFDSICKMTWFV